MVVKYKLALSCLLLLMPFQLASANESLTLLSTAPNEQGGEDLSISLQILFLMTMLSFLPALLMVGTAFTRIIVTFSILRQAIGLQQTPSNQILIGLALFLTFFIMAPVFEKVDQLAIQPYLAEEMTAKEAIQQASVPFRQFMMAQTRETDIAMFMQIGKVEQVDDPMDIPWKILMPAFVTSELKTAFQMGFLLFIPFLIIDIVVASVLMAMGMMMLSPLIVSLPFKIMLFVMVDGWSLIMGTVAASFGGVP